MTRVYIYDKFFSDDNLSQDKHAGSREHRGLNTEDGSVIYNEKKIQIAEPSPVIP